MQDLTYERLIHLLWYDPDTGRFIWQNSVRRGWNGKVAGSLCTGGYIQIIIDGHPYRANRLAWLYMTGEWPQWEVDHKNRIKTDNSWDNLRDITHQENSLNRRSCRVQCQHP